MKNVQKSALALAFLIALPAQAFDMPAMPELNAQNAVIGAALTGVAVGAYKYRSKIKNALSITATACKNSAIAAKDVVMNNKAKSAIVVAVVIAAGLIYKNLNTAVVEGVPSSTIEDKTSDLNPELPEGDAPVNEDSIEKAKETLQTIVEKIEKAKEEISDVIVPGSDVASENDLSTDADKTFAVVSDLEGK